MSGLEDWVVTTRNVFNPDKELFKKQVGMNWLMRNMFEFQDLYHNLAVNITHALKLKNLYEKELNDRYSNLDSIVIHQHISHIHGVVGYLSLEGSYLALTPIHDSNMKKVDMPVKFFEEEKEKLIELSNKLTANKIPSDKNIMEEDIHTW